MYSEEMPDEQLQGIGAVAQSSHHRQGTLHLGYAAESSEFVRFNHAKVRQAGQVQQASLTLKLINDGRHADLDITLAGEPELDRQRLAAGLQQLRETLPLLPGDPYLLLNHTAWQNHNEQARPLPDWPMCWRKSARLPPVSIWSASTPPARSAGASPVRTGRSAGIRPTASTSISACSMPMAKR
jgi:hypothetical protein